MKNWTLRTVLRELDKKVEEALGETIFDATSPVLDETVGDLIQMLSNHANGLPVHQMTTKWGRE